MAHTDPDYQGSIYYAAIGCHEAYTVARPNLPEHMTSILDAVMASGSWVTRICYFTESVFANRGQAGVDAPLLECASACGQVIALNGYYNALDGRVGGMILAMCRDADTHTPPEGSSWPDPSEDPAPKPQFMPPA